jgi:hypothetical protein
MPRTTINLIEELREASVDAVGGALRFIASRCSSRLARCPSETNYEATQLHVGPYAWEPPGSIDPMSTSPRVWPSGLSPNGHRFPDSGNSRCPVSSSPIHAGQVMFSLRSHHPPTDNFALLIRA